MIKITTEQIVSLKITSQEMIEWVNETIKNKKSMLLPEKISIKMDEGKIFYNVMPCVVETEGVAGVKVVTRYPNRTPVLDSKLSLYDLKTGYLKAIIDADFITTWRTAAVAIHSINLLAVHEFKIISFVGLGTIGKATLKMFLDTIDKKRKVEIRILNYKNIGESIVKQYEGDTNVTWKLFDNYIDMAKDSDIIVSAVTFAEEDFADESVYKKGVLLVPIHTRGFQNCDKTFDKIFGDDYNHIQGFKYFAHFKNFHEISDVINGICVGRENNEERIIAYNIGIALHDIVFAQKIMEKLYNIKEIK